MYRLNIQDAELLAYDIIDIIAKVSKAKQSKTLMFSPALGETIVIDSDKEPHCYGYEHIIEVVP